MEDKKLYLIRNVGCDDTTSGLLELTDEELDKLLPAVWDLNRNSYYGCMPTISIYPIDRSKIRTLKEYEEEENCSADDYLLRSDKLYHNGEIYTYAKGVCWWEIANDEDDLASCRVEVSFE